MEGYLGETPVDVAKHPKYSRWTPADWAMLFIGKYSGIDGDHHKTWVFYQAARILKGTPVEVVQARWDNGQTEDRFTVADPPSEDYKAWVISMTSGVNAGYDWDTGISP